MEETSEERKFYIAYSQVTAAEARLICIASSVEKKKQWLEKIRATLEECKCGNAFGTWRGSSISSYSSENFGDDAMSMDTISLASQGSLGDKVGFKENSEND